MKHLLLFLIILSTLLFTACVVPVQMPRVTLVESYTQNFDFGSTDIGKAELTLTLGLLIGPERVDQLTGSAAGQLYIDQMKEEKIVSKGISTLTFSLVPGRKTDAFFISGVGSYDIVDTAQSIVYFSANFRIVDTIHYPISMLTDAETIPIYFDQVLINHIDYDGSGTVWEHRPTEHVRIDAVLNRNIMNERNKPIFGLDYSADHEISVQGKTIGSIHFNPPRNPFDKIVDIRGLKLLMRRNYHKFSPVYEKSQ